jgi:hypothetical protein
MTSVAYGLAFPATRGVLAFHPAGGGFDPTALFSGNTGGYWDVALAVANGDIYQDAAGTTPAASDGDPVDRIDDYSGNGNTLVSNGGSGRPTLRNSGAQWWLAFNGTSHYLQAAFTLAQPYTRVSAAQQVSWTGGDRLWDGKTSNGGILFQNGTTPQVYMFAGSSNPFSSAMTVGANHVVTEIFDGASSVLAIDNNGDNTGNPGSADPDGATIGARGSASSGFSDILWFGAIWIGRALDSGEIADCRTFFGAKAGLSL